MIMFFQPVQRKNLRLLILSIFFIYSVSLFAEDKDEGLELPEVHIYGTYLGKMQFSPKKDFYPYLSLGTLYPLSHPFSPEHRIPAHLVVRGEGKRVQKYWMLLDAGGGNWWSDRIFLDCGLRNKNGLLSLRFTDFRRKNWAEDHSIVDDYVRLKGAFGQENYYLSGNILYDYNNISVGSEPWDDFVTQRGKVGILTKYNFNPVTLSFFGDYSLDHYIDRDPKTMPGPYNPETITEKKFHYLVKYINPLSIFTIVGMVNGENVSKSTDIMVPDNTHNLITSEILLKIFFGGTFEILPGLTVFLEEGEFSFAPRVAFRTKIPNTDFYPYLIFSERRRINSIGSAYQKTPFIADVYTYSSCKEKDFSGGIEGRWNHITFYGSYSHVEYENYPELSLLVGNSYRITPIDKKRDMIQANLKVDADQFIFSFDGSYFLLDRVLYEPVSEFKGEVSYTGIPRATPFVGLVSEFGIETQSDTVDVFSVNGGVEYQVLKNFALRLEVENIMDQRYEIWRGYTEGGVQFYASLKYKIIK
jgi:hypothetical protein